LPTGRSTVTLGAYWMLTDAQEFGPSSMDKGSPACHWL
jgi:hypothetical protein